ncbi:MAG: hypothetical protein AAF500_13900 [Myxococcota bacterium]
MIGSTMTMNQVRMKPRVAKGRAFGHRGLAYAVVACAIDDAGVRRA